jgi:hypothetical protein
MRSLVPSKVTLRVWHYDLTIGGRRVQRWVFPATKLITGDPYRMYECVELYAQLLRSTGCKNVSFITERRESIE